MKKKLTSIVIERAEGCTEDMIQVTAKSWEAAEKTIALMAQSAPPQHEGYDKTDFMITWEDGHTYKGCIDLQKEHEEGYDLRQHVTDGIGYMVADYTEAEKFLNKYVRK